MDNLSPIVLFAYSRKKSLEKTINYLKKNELAKKSELFIFSDGYKSKKDKLHVDQVRSYLIKIKGFKKIKIILRKKNLGLAKNIVSGVTEIIKKYNKVIVLEDDIIVSKNFLIYMNLCLDRFKREKKIWHINGWNYKFNFPKSDYNTFYWRGMICWGWATWKDRWKNYKKNPDYLIKNWTKHKISKFNFDNSIDFWSQVQRNFLNLINTWAIFWYSSIFNKNGICLSPIVSLTQNIGNDKFSTHYHNKKNCSNKIDIKLMKNKNLKFSFNPNIVENSFFYKFIKKKLYQKLSLRGKVKKFLINNNLFPDRF